MAKGDVRMAMSAIKSARWRSLLTMLGVIIGVSSVVITVSLGEGVKQQIVGQINHLGQDLLTVRSGKLVTRDNRGKIIDVNVAGTLGNYVVSEQDYLNLQKHPDVSIAVPFSLVVGNPQYANKQYNAGFVIGVTHEASKVLNQPIEFGSFFKAEEADKNMAVIGRKVAERLFEENVPVGKIFRLRGEEFVVRGVFEEFESNPLAPNSNYNTAIFIPYNVGKRVSGGQSQIQQVLIKPKDAKNVNQVADRLQKSLIAAHGGQDDITVLRQSDNLAVADELLDMLTALISAVAGISLFVGGIGIMNIMLVSVSERTREIGVRKALGATNKQIMNQFVTEAATLSVVGGFFGVLVSLFANALIRIFTQLEPVVTLPIMFIAVSTAFLVGVFFGATPALQAARKDPIEALRHE
ncbi:MAG: ABC transporter permease [Patescibacteria group bacterium]